MRSALSICANLLAPTVAEQTRVLLRKYTDQRIRFYTTREPDQRRDIF